MTHFICDVRSIRHGGDKHVANALETSRDGAHIVRIELAGRRSKTLVEDGVVGRIVVVFKRESDVVTWVSSADCQCRECHNGKSGVG